MGPSFARLLFRQPVGAQDVSVERLRALSKLRGLVAVSAIVLDLAIWALLRGDPAIDQEALGWFLRINLPILVVDVGIALFGAYKAPPRMLLGIAGIGAVLGVFTSFVWVQVSGSVSAYAIALPLTFIVMYRLAYDLRIGTFVYALIMISHITVVALELAGVLRAASLFVDGNTTGIYTSPGFVLASLGSITIIYTLSLLLPNYVMNRFHLKDVAIEEARDEARHGRLTGRVLGERFRLGEVIGRGGMGEVYQAIDDRARRNCAVKVLHPHLIGEGNSVRRFQREAVVAAQLGSPHIIEVHETGTTSEGLPFIVMELLTGEDLAQRLRRTGPMDAGDLLSLATQIAAGLTVAHDAGIVHRDLKPQNLFLCGELATPHVKLLDFGVCKVQSDGEGLTNADDLVGTPIYMAPEQIAGDANAIDLRADVFALGVIFYRALTGTLPFGGGDLAKVAYRIVNEVPALPSSIRTALHTDLDAVLMIAMAKRVNERFGSANELVIAFAAAVSGTLDPKLRERAAAFIAAARTPSGIRAATDPLAATAAAATRPSRPRP